MSSEPAKVAVIPARGGSKRIPRKNIRPFAGLPIIAHSIRAAQNSGLFGRIIVSTDDDEIADVAREHGAEVPFRRPADLSDDHAGTLPVIRHAVEWLRAEGMQPQAVCCIYATAPFLAPGDLERGWQRLQATGADYAFSATTFAFPVQRAFLQTDDGVQMLFPEHFHTRSQDLPETYHDAGQFYWGQVAAWLEERPFFTERAALVVLPRWRVQDIDTEEDWTRAEMLHEVARQRGGFRPDTPS